MCGGRPRTGVYCIGPGSWRHTMNDPAMVSSKGFLNHTLPNNERSVISLYKICDLSRTAAGFLSGPRDMEGWVCTYKSRSASRPRWNRAHRIGPLALRSRLTNVEVNYYRIIN